MSKFQHDVMLKIVKIIDLVMITIPFALCWELYYSYQVYAKFGWRGNWAMIGLFAVLFFLLGKTLCVEHTTPEGYAQFMQATRQPPRQEQER